MEPSRRWTFIITNFINVWTFQVDDAPSPCETTVVSVFALCWHPHSPQKRRTIPLRTFEPERPDRGIHRETYAGHVTCISVSIPSKNIRLHIALKNTGENRKQKSSQSCAPSLLSIRCRRDPQQKHPSSRGKTDGFVAPLFTKKPAASTTRMWKRGDSKRGRHIKKPRIQRPGHAPVKCLFHSCHFWSTDHAFKGSDEFARARFKQVKPLCDWSPLILVVHMKPRLPSLQWKQLRHRSSEQQLD